MNRSRRLLTIFVVLAVLLTGMFGVAAAGPSDQPGASPSPPNTGLDVRTQPVPSTADTAGTLAAISFRVLWCGVRGDVRLQATGSGALDGQPVAVTIVEAGSNGSEHIGLARMRVNNVAVMGGVITAWVTIEWNTPLCVWTHYVGI